MRFFAFDFGEKILASSLCPGQQQTVNKPALKSFYLGNGADSPKHNTFRASTHLNNATE
jgi:hypothetical protein